MKYTIQGEGFETVTRSDKTAAIKLADEQAKATKIQLEVVTDKGTTVHVAKVRKPQKRTKPYTRVDERDYADKLGEGVKLPRNFEVAYLRPRSSLALLRKVTEAGVDYLVFNLATGEREEVATTREGGARMRDLHKAELELVA